MLVAGVDQCLGYGYLIYCKNYNCKLQARNTKFLEEGNLALIQKKAQTSRANLTATSKRK